MDLAGWVVLSRALQRFHDLGWAGTRGLRGPARAFGGIVLAVEAAFVAACASWFLFGAPDLCGGAGIAAVSQLGDSRSDG